MMKNNAHNSCAWTRSLIAVSITLLFAITTVGVAASAQSVSTDKPDYSPGEVVTIFGAGFAPGSITLTVTRPNGVVDSIANVSADSSGNFTVTYQLDGILGTYTITATDTLGQTVQTTFTDGTVSAAPITIQNSTCTTNQTSFTLGDTVCAKTTITISGSGTGDFRIQWYNPSSTLVQDTPFLNSAAGTYTDTFTTNATGTWTVKTCKTSNAGACSVGNTLDTQTFTVNAPPTQFTLTVAGTGNGDGTMSGTGINCNSTAGTESGDCSETANSGTSFAVTANANSNSNFGGWSGCDSTSGSNNEICNVNLTSNRTITATFTLKQFTLTVQGDGTGNGTMSGTGINCTSTAGTESGDCSETADSGTAFAITASANGGSNFGGWSGCDSTSGSSNEVCNVNLTSDRTVTATFNTAPPTQFTLTVNGAGAGSGTVTDTTPGSTINCSYNGVSTSGDCTENYNNNTAVTLLATASSGSVFASWSGCDSVVGQQCNVTMNANKTVTVTFNTAGSAPGDFPGFPTSGYTSLGTDPNENGCDTHRNVLETFFKIDSGFLFLRMQTATDAGWPSNNSQGDARFKWFLDTSGNDGALSGGNILNFEYLLSMEDPPDNANDGFGAITFYDGSLNVLGGPVAGSGSAAPSGPQTAFSANFGYQISGTSLDMYIRLSTIGSPSSFTAFWATDQENPNLAQAPNCDRPDAGTFISFPGTIIVTKDVVPNDGSQWQISVTGQTSQTIGDGGQATFSNLTAGQYTVSESGPSGYSSAVDCGSKGSQSGTSISFTLNSAETVNCTFTNTLQQGTVIVEKQTNPDGDPTSFSFGGDLSGSISDGQQLSANKAPGQYSVTETVPSGWSLTSIVCDDANSSGNTGTATVTFNLEAGETVKCTFTNAKKPDLIAGKTNNDDDGSVTVGQTFKWSITVTNNSSGIATFSDGWVLLRDNLPSGPTYANLSLNTSGVTGTINCSITSNTLECKASGSVVMAANSSFTVSFDVTPNSSGSLINPAQSGVCQADPGGNVSESDETNNNCSPNTVTVLAPLQLDTTPPSCTIVTLKKFPVVLQVTVQDAESGLASIQVTKIINNTADITKNSTTIQSGITSPTTVNTGNTTDAVVVTATQQNKYKSSSLELKLTNGAGLITTCDPVVTLTIRENGKPVSETLTGIPQAESKVTIFNHKPGLNNLDITVNGKKFKVSGLKDNAVKRLDISAAMRRGNKNTITLTAYGKPGASATVVIGDVWVDSPNAQKSAMPLRVSAILALTDPTKRDHVLFAVRGQGIAGIEVRIFAVSGQVVYDSGQVTGSVLRWNLRNTQGQTLANGVYLYVLTIQGHDGRVIRVVKKLPILR